MSLVTNFVCTSEDGLSKILVSSCSDLYMSSQLLIASMVVLATFRHAHCLVMLSHLIVPFCTNSRNTMLELQKSGWPLSSFNILLPSTSCPYFCRLQVDIVALSLVVPGLDSRITLDKIPYGNLNGRLSVGEKPQLVCPHQYQLNLWSHLL